MTKIVNVNAEAKEILEVFKVLNVLEYMDELEVNM
jgi:hypothetical protein